MYGGIPPHQPANLRHQPDVLWLDLVMTHLSEDMVISHRWRTQSSQPAPCPSDPTQRPTLSPMLLIHMWLVRGSHNPSWNSVNQLIELRRWYLLDHQFMIPGSQGGWARWRDTQGQGREKGHRASTPSPGALSTPLSTYLSRSSPNPVFWGFMEDLVHRHDWLNHDCWLWTQPPVPLPSLEMGRRKV